MRRFIMRAYVAVAAGAVLGIGGVAGASASAAAPHALQAERVSATGTTHAAPSPGTQLWAKLYNGKAEFHADSVAVSPNGNAAFVTGLSGTIPAKYATIAYNTTTGARQWIKLYKSSSDEGCDFDNAVAVSPDSGTVFVTGECAYGISDAEYATVAYSAATGAQLWVTRYNGARTVNYGNAVAVSPNGKTVFVTGESDSKEYVARYATVAYNAATGAQEWAKLYGSGGPGKSNDIACSVAVSPDGNTVFVTGISTNAADTVTDDATVAYSAATGAQLWVQRHSGARDSTTDYHNSVAVSPTGGAVYVTAPGEGYATIAYNAATGAQLWAKRYSGTGVAFSVAVSPGGSTVFVTGDSPKGRSGTGYATVAYNAATGAKLWAKTHLGAEGAAPSAVAYSVAVSPSGGTVYVTGLSWKPGWDYATVAYNTTTGAKQWIKLYNLPDKGSAEGQGPVAEAVSPTSGTVIVTGGTAVGDWATVAYSG